MQFFGKSDTGMKRQENQDSFITEQLYENAVLCIVCDGMGGANGGSIASSLACKDFLAHIKKKLADIKQQGQLQFDGMNPEIEKFLKRSLALTNTAVYKKAVKEKQLEGMGTTMVAALITDNKLYVVNVGDSRLYFVNSDGITQLTRDHSYVQTLVDLGQITPEEAANNPHKNIITKAIGTQKKIDPDIFYKNLDEENCDTILMCSDGLTNFVDDEDIQAIMKEHGDLEEACNTLINKANENGGGDNVTAVLIKLDKTPSETKTEETTELK